MEREKDLEKSEEKGGRRSKEVVKCEIKENRININLLFFVVVLAMVLHILNLLVLSLLLLLVFSSYFLTFGHSHSFNKR